MPLDWVKYVAKHIAPLVMAFWRTLTFRAPFHGAAGRELALSIVGTAASLGLAAWIWGLDFVEDAKWAFATWLLVWLVVGGLFKKLPQAPVFAAFVFAVMLLAAPAPTSIAGFVAERVEHRVETQSRFAATCPSGDLPICMLERIEQAQRDIVDLRRHVTRNGLRYCAVAHASNCRATYLQWLNALTEEQRQEFVWLRTRAEASVDRVNDIPMLMLELWPHLAAFIAPFIVVFGYLILTTAGSMSGVLGARLLGAAAAVFAVFAAIVTLFAIPAYRVGVRLKDSGPHRLVSPLDNTAWEPNASFETLGDLYRAEARWRDMWDRFEIALPEGSPCRLVIRVRPEGYATPGATISHTVDVKNTGDEPCNDVHVQIEPPAQYASIEEPLIASDRPPTARARLEPGFYSQPAWQSDRRLLHWLVIVLEPNEEVSATWTGIVAAGITCPTTIEHLAFVSSVEYQNYHTWVRSPVGRTEIDCAGAHNDETQAGERAQRAAAP